VLELGLTRIHTFVWVVIRAGGDTNGPPCGRLLWAFIQVFADGKTMVDCFCCGFDVAAADEI
jgi:hypothetical protein